MKSNFFPFMNHAFGIKYNLILSSPRSRRISPMCFTKSFIVFFFTFNYCKPFWVNFSVKCEFGVKVHFFPPMNCSTPFVKNAVVTPLNFFTSVSKHHLCTFVWAKLWVFLFCPIIYKSIPLPILDYSGCVISTEPRWKWSLSVVSDSLRPHGL